jgi:type IV secretion system protein VirB10
MTMDQADFNVDAGEDDLLVSGRKRRQLTGGQKIGVAVIVTIVFLSFIWIDYSLQLRSSVKQPEMAFRPRLGNYRSVPITLPESPEIAAAPPPPTTRAGEMTPADSPLLAFGESSATATDASVGSPAPAVPFRSAVSQIVPRLGDGYDSGNEEGSIAARLKPTVLEPTKAAALPHPDFLITKGTIVPCTLQTAISTDLPGFVKCVLPEAVRGTTGNVVLLDRGTTVVGEIQSGLSQGQHRAFILWDRAETPSHAVVTLASPTADNLGRSGVPGEVNNHFWQRFGGAMLLTVVQGSFQAGTALASQSGGSSNAYLNNFQSNGERATDSALQSSMNIRPTLEKKQGETISIIVARDLDFSDIYSLR